MMSLSKENADLLLQNAIASGLYSPIKIEENLVTFYAKKSDKHNFIVIQKDSIEFEAKSLKGNKSLILTAKGDFRNDLNAIIDCLRPQFQIEKAIELFC